MRPALALSSASSSMQDWIARLASPWLTIVFFLLAAAGALATAHKLDNATPLMALPFALLGVNLGAAIVAHPRFRADLPLLLFHLALLALVLLFVFGRLTYFDGQAILTRAVPFEGHFDSENRGPLHGDGYRKLSFVNAGFVDYGPQGRYTNTVNRVRWKDPASGQILSAEISGDRPLALAGYRIYPTEHRGFSPRLAWRPDSGAAENGAIPLPRLTAGQEEFPRGVAWRTSDGSELWAQIVTPVPSMELQRRPNLGIDGLDHVLVIRQDDARHELRPGQSIALKGGRLDYLALDSWIGYRIVRDPTESWLAATIVVAVASLVWFYLRRLGRHLPDEDVDDAGAKA
jgi:hypothetical protein